MNDSEKQLKEKQLKEKQLKEKKLEDKQLKEKKLKEKQLKEKQLKEKKLEDKQLEDKQLKPINALKLNLQTNYIFYIVSGICSLLIYYFESKKINFDFFKKCVLGIITLYIAGLIGYLIHIMGHNFIITDYLNNTNNILKEIPILNKIIYFIAYFLDFHDKIHHNTGINKEDNNLIIEFIMNFITQGLAFYLLIKFLKYIDEKFAILWGLAYSTVHLINYNLKTPQAHIEHHIDQYKNYGMDIFDIIFGTKYNLNTIENYNHYSINFIIITCIIIIKNIVII